MSKIFKSIDELIGNTPLLELLQLKQKKTLKANVFA